MPVAVAQPTPGINSAGLTSDLSIKQNLMIKDDFFNTRNWNKTLDVNLNGVFYCIKYFLKFKVILFNLSI